MLIDGSLVRASNGAVFDTVNPATEEVLGVVADASDADAERALESARRAFDESSWSTDVALRVRCLRQLQAAMRSHAEELRAMTIAETGSPLFMTRSAQLDDPVESLGWVADLAEDYEWMTDLGRAEPLGMPAQRWIIREPAGVVAAITPWNVPHQINLAKLGPALAAGNTVILKPAPDTPWCATVLGRMVAEETDIPSGVLNILPSSDAVFGARLVSDPRVDQVSFTGSTATGRKVMAQAAATLKKVFLELGGKSAFVVLDDADLRGACGVAAFTVCVHAGQGCAITTRLVVPRRHFDEAVDGAASALGQTAGRGPHRRRHHLRPAHQRPPAHPGRGLHRHGRATKEGPSWWGEDVPPTRAGGSSWSRRSSSGSATIPPWHEKRSSVPSSSSSPTTGTTTPCPSPTTPPTDCRDRCGPVTGTAPWVWRGVCAPGPSG